MTVPTHAPRNAPTNAPRNAPAPDSMVGLCTQIADLSRELRLNLAARDAYRAKLDAWWAGIDANRAARLAAEASPEAAP